MKNFNLGDIVSMGSYIGFISKVYYDGSIDVIDNNEDIIMKHSSKKQLSKVPDYTNYNMCKCLEEAGINKHIVVVEQDGIRILNKKRSKLIDKIKEVNFYLKDGISTLEGPKDILFQKNALVANASSYKEPKIKEKLFIQDGTYYVEYIRYYENDDKVDIIVDIPPEKEPIGNDTKEIKIKQNTGLLVRTEEEIIFSTETPTKEMLGKHLEDHIIIDGINYVIDKVEDKTSILTLTVSPVSVEKIKVIDDETESIILERYATEEDKKISIYSGATCTFNELPYIIKDIHHDVKKVSLPLGAEPAIENKITDMYRVSLNRLKLNKDLSMADKVVIIDRESRYKALSIIDLDKKDDYYIQDYDLFIINNNLYGNISREYDSKTLTDLNRIYYVDLMKPDIDKADKQLDKKIADIWNDFSNLEQTHPDDIIDFKNGIHVLQYVIGMRKLRRESSTDYPTYEKHVSHSDSGSKTVWRKKKIHFIK